MDKLQFLVLIELKAAAKCQLNDAQRRRFEGIFKARAKTDRNNYLSRIADEVEEDLHHNNMRSAFRAIETLAGQKHSLPVLSCIHKADGIPCRSNEQVMQRWSEHFTAAFNHLSAITTSTSLESESVSAVPDPNVRAYWRQLRPTAYYRRSHPSHQKVEEWPCRWFRWYFPQTAEMCYRPYQLRLTLYSSKSGDLA